MASCEGVHEEGLTLKDGSMSCFLNRRQVGRGDREPSNAIGSTPPYCIHAVPSTYVFYPRQTIGVVIPTRVNLSIERLGVSLDRVGSSWNHLATARARLGRFGAVLRPFFYISRSHLKASGVPSWAI